ncbi:PH domain-like protein [Lentithecium fluviatile CBS 122367]|uniref:PH domain-like protein n=1 Tax=Lentithecium fluviatile CBS 122367 TaxID=1168545 RepID=A0A6G1IQK7_9PLEO|nr:PH domain-like protein [Lentithecium fluviatile CBS 122367]
MAPNKSKARAVEDEAALPQTRSNEELNLSVIRRHYPQVAAIHYVAPYSVLYAYMLETSQWEKVGIEGSLFVCELVPSQIGVERFAVILLNRRGLDNFFNEITGPEHIDFGEFIMMQSDQVYGLWIFSEPHSSTANVPAEIQAKLEELAARAKASREAKEREIESGMTEAEQVEASVPMGRQVSLRELFGQRPTVAAAVVHAHNNSHPAALPGGQADVLGQLFMKAKQDYNGLG